MAIPFNPISITIGKDGLSSFKSLRIDQSTGAHHHFDLTVDLESGGNRQVHNISSSKEWLGKDIIVKAANKPFFCGIVTNIELHRDGSDFGCIQVSGYSSTYRMETAPSCYSWNDRSIGDVVKSLCSDGKVQLALNAAHKKQLDYICQYEESDFDFVRRLALQYQEWMYYDGLKLVFGKPRRLPDPIKMEFGTSLSSLNIGLQTLARPEQVFTFHSGANREMDRKTPDKAYGHDRMAGDAFRAALPSYPKAARQYSIQRVSSIDDLENYVLLKQAAETAETHYVTAESQDPRLHVGSVISLYSSFLKGVGNLSQESLGDFIIIEMTHEVSESCYYKNRFKAIPGTVMSLPNPKVEMPLAETQMATVLSNADPHGAGRVQVRMNWQTDNMRTSWVRVMTPDGGGSKDVKSNRGFVFIPEVGDQVLLGFRHGDPARPYVMGSLFNGTTGNGGGSNNSIKSLKTRSGISVILNDDNKSLAIKDAGGSSIYLDGNGNILLNAPKNIQLHAGNDMSLMVGHDLQVNVGNSQTTNIGNMLLTNVMQKILVNTPFMQQLVADFFHTQAGKALLNSQKQIKIEAPETNVVGEQELFIHSANKTVVNSQGTMEMRGEQGMHELNTAKEYKTTKKELDCDTVVFLQPTSSYAGEFGFDWYRKGNSGIDGDFAFEKIEMFQSDGKQKMEDKGIIGRYYKIVNENGKKTKKTSGNYEDTFETLKASIQRQRLFYEQWNISWLKSKPEVKIDVAKENKVWSDTKDEKDYEHIYFVPIMTIMKDVSNIRLTADVRFNPDKKERPKVIKIEFTKPIEGLMVKPSILQVKEGEVELTLTCTKEFDTETYLVVKADDKVCGKVKILPNSKNYQKELKMVVVCVRTKLDGEKEVTGEIAHGGIDLFRTVMKQALINVPQEVPSEILDCTQKTFTQQFSKNYNNQGDTTHDISIIYEKRHSMNKYLEQELTKACKNKYANYYKLFIFPDYCYKTIEGHKAQLNGYGYLDKKNAFFFKGHEDGTIAHEVCHCLGLDHTFDFTNPNRTIVAYQYGKTTNMLDYSHHFKIKRNCLFYWQWKKINLNIR